LDALLKAGVLSVQAHQRAVAHAQAAPDAQAWKRFAERAALALGAACGLAGLVFFIAWNWDGLPRFAQFGALEALMVAAAWASTRAPDTFARQMALTFAAAVIGPLLAAYGQAYQTGADPFELFLTWALLATPLAAVARFAPLWMAVAVLLDTSLALFLEQVQPFGAYPWEYTPPFLAALNALMWLGFELWRGSQRRWPARVLALWAGTAALPMACLYASGDRWLLVGTGEWSLVAVLAISAITAFVYRGKRLDVFMLSLAAFCLSFVAGAFVWRLLGLEHHWYLAELPWRAANVVLGLFFVAEAALSVVWIRRCRKGALA
jgi:uncharacterized membrane protein